MEIALFLCVTSAGKEVALKRPEYGYRRVKYALKHKGAIINKKRVYKIMKQDGLSFKKKRKYVATTESNHSLPFFPNLVSQFCEGQSALGERYYLLCAWKEVCLLCFYY